jgi:hypothetical protein
VLFAAATQVLTDESTYQPQQRPYQYQIPR